MCNLTAKALLEYEIRASFWADKISIGFLQDLVASYFAWKVNRKHGRYLKSKQMQAEVAELVAKLRSRNG